MPRAMLYEDIKDILSLSSVRCMFVFVLDFVMSIHA
uniref:Uncharacterized protein n=1 Tax=Rhizophora mucronata TaxID=61149 RepID=A0A2P2NGA5_RHIMU